MREGEKIPHRGGLRLRTRVSLLMLSCALLLFPTVLLMLNSLRTFNRLTQELASEAGNHPAVSAFLGAASAALTSAYRDGLLLLMLGASLVLLLAVLVPPRLFRPITSLVRAMTQTQRGDLGAHVEIDRHDELGELAKAFNVAVGKLRIYDRLKTERIIAEAQRVAMLAEHLPTGVAIADPDHLTIIIANSRLTAMAGSGLAGREIHDLLTLEDEDIDRDLKEVALLRESLKGKKGYLNAARKRRIPVTVDLDFSRSAAGETGTIAVFVRRTRPREKGSNAEGRAASSRRG